MRSAYERLIGDHGDTQSRWSALHEGERFYTRARHRLHESLLWDAFTGSPVDQPTATVLAGGPASGKSTLLQSLTVPTPFTLVDPDSFKTRLPEFGALVADGDQRAASVVHEESSDLAAELLRRAAAARHHVVIDQLGDGPPGRFLTKLRTLLDLGFEVAVAYADVPVDVASERNVERAGRTGRLVAESDLRTLHREVSARFTEVIEVSELRSVALYDCSEQPPSLVAEYAGGSSRVVNADKLKAFRAKANLSP